MNIQELTEEFKTNNEVCIVGTANTWNEAPYSRSDSIDFWGLNGLHQFFTDEDENYEQHFDLWFQIHKYDRVLKQDKHVAWIRDTEIPCFMQEDVAEEFENAVVFPADEILEIYEPYFSSTFAWMLTLAMEMGYEKIYLYGVHCSSKSEFGYQKPNAEYYLGMAKARGIEIEVPSKSDLMRKDNIYAYGKTKELLNKFDKEIEDLENKRDAHQETRWKNQLMAAKYEGAISQAKYWRRILS